jgi:hypothetical protein
MIRLPPQEGKRPIELFQKKHPGHSVGQGHGGQGEAEVGLLFQGFLQSIRPAQEKNNFLGNREFVPNPSTLLLENIGNPPLGWDPFFRDPDQGEVRIAPNPFLIDLASLSYIRIGGSAYEDEGQADFFHS